MRPWTDFRCDSYYAEILAATAEVWLTLATHLLDGRGTGADREAYERATKDLAQLPLEFGNAELRFHRCRWRHGDIGDDEDLTKRHCEHPWTKKRTKAMILSVVEHVRVHDVSRGHAVSAIAAILDARQDTVLMPDKKLKRLGIVTGRGDDGFAERYEAAIAKGLMLRDLATGEWLDVSAVRRLSAERAEQVTSALVAIGFLAVDTSC